MSRTLFAAPPAQPSRLTPAAQFACAAQLLRWLGACVGARAGSALAPGATALAAALEDATSVQGAQAHTLHTPLTLARDTVAPALSRLAPALAAHCSAVGAGALAGAWGGAVLFPLLFLAEAAVRGRRGLLQAPSSAPALGEAPGPVVEAQEEASESEEEGAAPLFSSSVAGVSGRRGGWSGSASASGSARARIRALQAPVLDEACWQREVLRFTGGQRGGGRQGRQAQVLGGWRARVDALESANGALQQGLRGPAQGLSALAVEVHEQLARVGAVEHAINATPSHALSACAAQAAVAARAVGEGEARVHAARAGVASVSARLWSVEEEVEALGAACAAAASGLTGSARLLELRTALRALQRDNRDMDVQVGMLRSAVSALVLQGHEESRRRARSAARGGGGGF